MAQTHIDLPFADGVYRFKLNLPQIDELQAKCGGGILEIFARVMAGGTSVGDEIILSPAAGKARLEDLVETIRQGLIGGNQGSVLEKTITVSPMDADRLLKNYLTDRPLMEVWEMAFSIMGACVMGFTPPEGEDDEGNDQAAAKNVESEIPETD